MGEGVMFDADIPSKGESLVERSIAAIDSSVKPGTSSVLDQAQFESAAKSIYEVCEQLKLEAEALKPKIDKVNSIKGPNDKDIEPDKMILRAQSVLVQLINRSKEAEVDRKQLSDDLRLLYSSMLGNSLGSEGLVSLVENYNEVSENASDIVQVRSAVITGKSKAERPLSDLEKRYPFDEAVIKSFSEAQEMERQAELAKKNEELNRSEREKAAKAFKSPTVGETIWNGIKAAGSAIGSVFKAMASPLTAMTDYIVRKLTTTPAAPIAPDTTRASTSMSKEEVSERRYSISEAQRRPSISEVDPIERMVKELGLEDRPEVHRAQADRAAKEQMETVEAYFPSSKPKGPKSQREAAMADKASDLATVKGALVDDSNQLPPLPSGMNNPNEAQKQSMAAKVQASRQKADSTRQL